ncbi:MAG: hypothetical protein K6E75_02860 [Lachnospiraceae bacterium]|nr:hypothetical protein [Lachnospiraceae bacterium]
MSEENKEIMTTDNEAEETSVVTMEDAGTYDGQLSVSEDGRSEKELLQELVELQKKTANRQLVATVATCTLAGAFIIALLIVVPKLLTMSAEISAMVANTEKLVTEADELIAQTEKSLTGIDTMISNVNDLVVDNTEAVSEALKNIQDIDIDQLNEAIRNLSDAVEPLAKLNNNLSGFFGGVGSGISNGIGGITEGISNGISGITGGSNN